MYSEVYQVSARMEEPAKWLQWAETSYNQEFRQPNDSGEKKTRYNLGQFWAANGAIGRSADADTLRQCARLDYFAHNLWARLEAKLAMAADTNSQERRDHSATSEQAYARAAQLAEAAKAPALAKSAANQVAANKNLNAELNRTVPDDRYSTAFKEQTKNVFNTDFLGLPLWAWGAGALALVLLISTSGPRMVASVARPAE